MNWKRILFGVQRSRPVVEVVKPVSVFDQVAAEYELPDMAVELYRAQVHHRAHMDEIWGTAA